MMETVFGTSFEYKLIYVFAINDEAHKGLLKIGDTTIQSDASIDALFPNCKALNQAALSRIKQYTNTAGISAQLLHTELAVRLVKGKDGQQVLKAFRDHDVHRVLENSGIPKKKLKNSTSREWFGVDLPTALKAIEAVKKCQPNLSGTGTGTSFTPIVFRPEQEEAIEKTLKQFKTGSRMLWNAKMRFGKTLSALQVVKKSGFSKTIIVTHRPVVDDGWYEDFQKIFYDTDDYTYGSKGHGATMEDLLNSGKKFVYFASIQDLRGSSTVCGKFDKNDIVFSLDWDLVIVDEAHEGTTTALGDDVIKMVDLTIPYVKDEFVKQRMSDYIDDIVKGADSYEDERKRIKYIRDCLGLKKLFGVMVTDMNAIRLNLYKRERIKEQSRYLRYEEAVGSTGQSQGIYIQFLVAVINYIAGMYSLAPEESVQSKTIFIDNPFGAAKDIYIWEPIFAMLAANHVQLIVPARGATPAITGRFDVNYILGQQMVGGKQQTVVVDYTSKTDQEELEYQELSYEQATFDFI